MQTPADYFDRYHNIDVRSPNEGDADLATGLRVDKYRLNRPQDGTKWFDERTRVGNKILKDWKIRQKADPKATITVRVRNADGDGEHTYSDFKIIDSNQLWLLIRYPYMGKGSPEGIQALLQLASVSLPGSPAIVQPADFQSYCDNWLGLDCNGFVGNYLRHVRNGIDWWDVTATESGVSPDKDILNIFNSFDGIVRNSADEIDFNELNLLVMVNRETGKIVKGRGDGYGHIMISQPKEFDIEVGLKRTLGVPDSQEVPGIYVVESTGADDANEGGRDGLAKSFYHFVDYKPFKGVMRVKRGINGTDLLVRIKGAEWRP